MYSVRIFLIALLTFALGASEGAKILGIFPYRGPSQYIVVKSYFRTLAERGHEVTVVNQFPQKKQIPNFRDIVIKSEGYEEMINTTVNGDPSEAYAAFEEYARNATLLILENPEVQELIYSGKYHFDLVIVETLLCDSIYALGPHFGAHLIGISTYGTDVIIDKLVGNTSPLSYIPSPTSPFTDRMNFWERLRSLIHTTMEWHMMSTTLDKVHESIYRKYFPHLPYQLDEIRKNFSLMLLNQHFALSYPRPYVPNMIEVGGMYINEKVSSLPKDIEDFINGAEHGVIYFSMGSNVKSQYFNKQRHDAVLKVFGSLKQRVLWKFEEPNLPDKPDNVMIGKWFPQSDILAHPKVKLFITHAGLLSTIESIYHAKPVVGIPVFFDQFLNIERSKKMGFGLKVSYMDLNEKYLKEAVLEILQNDSYTKAVQKISKRYHDQPMKPLDRAIYWTEYILRHDGAEFMRVAAQDLNFFQYHSLDTIGFILGIILTLIVIIILVLRWTIKFICRKINNCSKRKEE